MTRLDEAQYEKGYNAAINGQDCLDETSFDLVTEWDAYYCGYTDALIDIELENSEE